MPKSIYDIIMSQQNLLCSKRKL